MDLYFSPLSCSLGSRIALYEADLTARFIEVDPKTKRTSADTSYLDLHPLGLVPFLRTDDDKHLSENAAILQYIADQRPALQLAPAAGFARSQLQQWLCFIGTELHKALFMPLLDIKANDAVKAYAITKGRKSLDHVARHLQEREYLLDGFSVADAYLFAVLNWTAVTPLKLSDWPSLVAYHKRLAQRPAIARAMQEEVALYKRAQAPRSDDVAQP
ncbi:MAG: glutathione binding-like protein [Polyangiales bacterium]